MAYLTPTTILQHHLNPSPYLPLPPPSLTPIPTRVRLMRLSAVSHHKVGELYSMMCLNDKMRGFIRGPMAYFTPTTILHHSPPPSPFPLPSLFSPPHPIPLPLSLPFPFPLE